MWGTRVQAIDERSVFDVVTWEEEAGGDIEGDGEEARVELELFM